MIDQHAAIGKRQYNPIPTRRRSKKKERSIYIYIEEEKCPTLWPDCWSPSSASFTKVGFLFFSNMCWHKSRWCLILCAHQSFLFYGSTFLTTRKFILFAKAASFTFLCKKSKKWKKKSIDVFKIESNCPIIYFSLSSNLKKKGRNPVRLFFFFFW